MRGLSSNKVRLLIPVTVIVTVLLVAGWISLNAHYINSATTHVTLTTSLPPPGGPPSLPYEKIGGRKVGLGEAVSACRAAGYELLVPGWVPGDLSFREVWMFGDCGSIIIRYSDEEIGFQGPLPVSERKGHPKMVVSVYHVADEELIVAEFNETVRERQILLERGYDELIRYLMEERGYSRRAAERYAEELEHLEIVEVRGITVLVNAAKKNRFGEPAMSAGFYYGGKTYQIVMLATRYTRDQLVKVVASMLAPG